MVDLATGSSLGLRHRRHAAVGVALAAKNLDELDYRTWVLCGDSETAEGSVWEALDKAAHYELSNFTVLIDVNRLGQRGPTELEWDLDTYAARVEAFGCRAVKIDGHNLEQIDAAFDRGSASSDRPTVDPREDPSRARASRSSRTKRGWHRRQGWPFHPKTPSGRDRRSSAGTSDTHRHEPARASLCPRGRSRNHGCRQGRPSRRYELGAKVATRKAFGDTLAALSARPDVVVLDAEVGNSTHADLFQKVAPERYFETFIAEQLMVGAAGGFAARGYVPFASTFGAFFARAADFVRMLAISGPFQQRSGSSDPTPASRSVRTARPRWRSKTSRSCAASSVRPCSTRRTMRRRPARDSSSSWPTPLASPTSARTRGAYPVLYGPDEHPVHDRRVDRRARVRRTTRSPSSAPASPSISCLAAADKLADEGICVHGVDRLLFDQAARYRARSKARRRQDRVRFVVVEDHYAEGGLGEAVASAMIRGGAARRRWPISRSVDLSSSGTPEELLRAAKISAGDIADAARKLIKSWNAKTGSPPACPSDHPAVRGEAYLRRHRAGRPGDTVVIVTAGVALAVTFKSAIRRDVNSERRRHPAGVDRPLRSGRRRPSRLHPSPLSGRPGYGGTSLDRARTVGPARRELLRLVVCRSARRSSPRLAASARRFGDVAFVGIDTNVIPPHGTATTPWPESAGIVLPARPRHCHRVTIARAYGVSGLPPTTFVVDRDGPRSLGDPRRGDGVSVQLERQIRSAPRPVADTGRRRSGKAGRSSRVRTSPAADDAARLIDIRCLGAQSTPISTPTSSSTTSASRTVTTTSASRRR